MHGAVTVYAQAALTDCTFVREPFFSCREPPPPFPPPSLPSAGNVSLASGPAGLTWPLTLTSEMLSSAAKTV